MVATKSSKKLSAKGKTSRAQTPASATSNGVSKTPNSPTKLDASPSKSPGTATTKISIIADIGDSIQSLAHRIPGMATMVKDTSATNGNVETGETIGEEAVHRMNEGERVVSSSPTPEPEKHEEDAKEEEVTAEPEIAKKAGQKRGRPESKKPGAKKPKTTGGARGRPPKVSEPVDDKEYEVEKITDSRKNRRLGNLLEYSVKWTGFKETTWEPAKALSECTDHVNAFHKAHPTKPGPS